MGIVICLENGERKSMSTNAFVNKLNRIDQSRMPVFVYMNPVVEKLPLPIARYDDPFLPFGKGIIDATGDLVCGYIFDLASYLVLGGAGIVALERTIRYIPAETIGILHGPFWGTAYSVILHHTALGLDAVTIVRPEDSNAYAGTVLYETETQTDLPAAYLSLRNRTMVLQQEDDTRTMYTIMRDETLYANRLDDYADQVREALMQDKGWRD
jgi:hypothetical protein